MRWKFLGCRRNKSAYSMPWSCEGPQWLYPESGGEHWPHRPFLNHWGFHPGPSHLARLSSSSPFSEAVQPPLPNHISQLHLWQQRNLLLSFSVNLVLWWPFYVLRGCPFLSVCRYFESSEVSSNMWRNNWAVSTVSYRSKPSQCPLVCFVDSMQVFSDSLWQRVWTPLQQKGRHQVCDSFQKLCSGHHVWPTIIGEMHLCLLSWLSVSHTLTLVYDSLMNTAMLFSRSKNDPLSMTQWMVSDNTGFKTCA